MGTPFVYASSGVPSDTIPSIARNYHAIASQPSLERVVRLSVLSLDRDQDRLRAFLASWAALEIFVAKLFSQYEDDTFALLTGSQSNSSAETFLKSMRKVVNGKYRLADKFALVAGRLAPADSVGDLTLFMSAKKQRDNLAHGQDVDESALPVDQVQSLLRKYLALHIQKGALTN